MFSSLFPKKTKPNTITATAIKGDKSCNPEELEIISVISNKRKRHQRQRLSRNIIEDEKQVTQRNSDRVSRRQKKNKDKISHEQLQLNKVAAMELSNRLQDLSNKKNLREALELYWDNISVCDGHHASIIINCCSRCGAVEEGEKVISHLIQSGQKVSVQANTALLKGYVHSGLIYKAVRLFGHMCTIKGEIIDKYYRPNVRTFNTLARGCLWNAATLIKESKSTGTCNKREITDEQTTVIGGVLSLEEAWIRSKELQMSFDASSFEYSVTALCFALRVTDAEQRIMEMKEAIQSPCDLNDSLRVCLVALARAYAVLGRQKEAKKNAKAALSIVDQPYKDTSKSSRLEDNKHRHIVGGKQGWKTKQTVLDDQCGDNRSTSNAIFRNHRISELKMEAESIVKVCENEMLLAQSNDILVNLLESRLLCFCGGGTTDLNAVKNNYDIGVDESVDATRMQLLVPLWFSFGLSAAFQRQSRAIVESYQGQNKLDVRHAATSIPDLIKDRYKGFINHDGFVDFPHVFRPLWSDSFQSLKEADRFINTSQTKPIYIELGSGSGDWIVSQAITNPSINFVAVELRADRVAQTFAKLSLSLNTSVKTSIVAPICNLCCVGSECGVFLKSRVQNHTISKIFVNHPEPPTQTCGTDHLSILPDIDTDEPAHMLNSSTLLHAAHCLKLDGEGQLIIVTDNLWYGRLICLTLVKLLSQHTNILRPVDLASDHSLRLFQSFIVPNSGNKVDLYVSSGIVRHENSTTWQLKQERGNSYFDRLWRAGGGKHAHKSDRYIILMQTCGNLTAGTGGMSNSTMRSNLNEQSKVLNESSTKGRSGKKRKARSPQKQAIRNKKRLARRNNGM